MPRTWDSLELYKKISYISTTQKSLYTINSNTIPILWLNSNQYSLDIESYSIQQSHTYTQTYYNLLSIYCNVSLFKQIQWFVYIKYLRVNCLPKWLTQSTHCSTCSLPTLSDLLYPEGTYTMYSTCIWTVNTRTGKTFEIIHSSNVLKTMKKKWSLNSVQGHWSLWAIRKLVNESLESIN